MLVIPYHSIMNITFGSSREAIIAALGKPEDEGKTSIWACELLYEKIVFRIDENNQLKEITADLKEIELSGKTVLFNHLKKFIKTDDTNFFETVGFIVSPKYGLAFDPEFQSWITFFDKNELPKWHEF